MVILADLESALQKRQIGTANKNTRRGGTISMQLKNEKAFDKNTAISTKEKYQFIHNNILQTNSINVVSFC